MLSKACEYAIRSVIYIASKTMNGEKVGIKEIAVHVGSPEAFTGKILQQLAKDKIIESSKGPTGGFYLSDHQLETISLADIITSIDGDKIFNSCVLGLQDCSEMNPCPVHSTYRDIRGKVNAMFYDSKIKNLSLEIMNGKGFLI